MIPIAGNVLRPRFMAKVSVTDGCWDWLGAKAPNGYGRAWDGARVVVASRLAYELFVGPIPEGYHIDHLCSHPGCVNPAHLEVVTQAENNRRAGERRTTCRAGHSRAEHGYISRRGQWMCRLCMRRWNSSRFLHPSQRTHCIHGHPFDEANTYHYKGRRACRTCLILRKRQYRARLR